MPIQLRGPIYTLDEDYMLVAYGRSSIALVAPFPRNKLRIFGSQSQTVGSVGTFGFGNTPFGQTPFGS
jgi:hypothetical protein